MGRFYRVLVFVTVGISLMSSASSVWAEADSSLNPMVERYTADLSSEHSYAMKNGVLLSQNNEPHSSLVNDKANKPESSPWLTGHNVHKYLGLATLASALATAMTAPDKSQTPDVNGTHATLGRTTRVLALSTVVSGLIVHWDDIHLFEDGLSDPDTQHWLLAGLGALVLADAVAKAPANSHSAQAEAGALAMAIGVKLVW